MENIDPSNLTNDNINLLLTTITSPQPSNVQIKQSTELLKKYSENIQSVEGLLFQIKTNQDFKNQKPTFLVTF